MVKARIYGASSLPPKIPKNEIYQWGGSFLVDFGNGVVKNKFLTKNL
jgi:hypothetical protein